MTNIGKSLRLALCLNIVVSAALSLTKQAAEALASGARPKAAGWATNDVDTLLVVKHPNGRGVAFCPTPKVASTLWKILLQRLAGNERWFEMATTPHYEIVPKFGHGLAYGLKRVRWNESTEPGAPPLLEDPTYQKVAFFRDPLERVKSAYLDKCQNAPDWERAWSCHGPWIKENRTVDFDEFTSHLLENKDSLGKHLRPQVDYCGLHMEGNVDRFDVFTDMALMEQSTHKLMETLGLSEYLEGWPNGGMFDRGNAKGHATNAGNSSLSYSEDTKKALMTYYSRSYNLLTRFTCAANTSCSKLES